MDFDPSSGTLFGVDDGTDGGTSRLFTLNQATGEATMLADVTVNGAPAAGFQSLAIGLPAAASACSGVVSVSKSALQFGTFRLPGSP